MAKKKLDNLMKESKIRDREDPDSFTIAALPPAGKPSDKTSSKVEMSILLHFYCRDSFTSHLTVNGKIICSLICFVKFIVK